MKDKSTTFFILTLITGIVGFTLGDFAGILFVRILFVIFADLFVVSILAKGLFSDSRQVKNWN
ncbi:hypothetical protein SAMN04488096_108129 [Mesonia phycicola]|uniref:DUF1328 domain-containing protein n=1 Tax=Mesonia phycicola TaxID=579105 RepID=A0A1M6GNM3_9FLAO|nr:hypothetical protein [Mesonia phycicola]SHJ11523.1 hypothetical protein SAMN04488096_108129 [Mesonia phycicola]